MILYLDASALVKLYVRETGSVRVRNGLTNPRRHRERVARLNVDWESFMRVELSPSVVRLAGETAETYELRGFDSIHLAGALWLRGRTDIPCTFAAFDQRLHDGATRAGLSVLP